MLADAARLASFVRGDGESCCLVSHFSLHWLLRTITTVIFTITNTVTQTLSYSAFTPAKPPCDGSAFYLANKGIAEHFL